MKRIVPAAVGVLALALSACAPLASTPSHFLSSDMIKRPGLFYPQRTGFTWVYESEDQEKIVAELTGPQEFQGRTYDTRTFTIGDNERVQYLNWNSNGISLVAEVEGDTIRTYNPPVKMYPSARALNVGAEWGGASTVTEVLQAGTSDEFTMEWEFEYHHKVVDRQGVRAGRNVYDAFKLDYQADMTTAYEFVGRHVHRDVWFAPFVGEIRTRDGYWMLNTTVNTTAQALPAPEMEPITGP